MGALRELPGKYSELYVYQSVMKHISATREVLWPQMRWAGWRWAAILASFVILGLRVDLPAEPTILLTIYFVVTAVLFQPLRLQSSPVLLGVLDITMITLSVLTGGGEQSPLFILYIATALDLGTRVSLRASAVFDVFMCVAYATAAWAAALESAYSFDSGLTVARWFLILAAGLTSSGLSQSIRLEREHTRDALALSNMMRLAVVAALDMQAVLQTLIEQICSSLRSDFGVIYLVDAARPAGERNGHDGARDLAVHGFGPLQTEKLAAMIETDPIWHEALQSGHVVAHVYSSYAPGRGVGSLAGRVSAVACVPLVLEREAIGFIWVAYRTRRQLEEGDLNLLALLSQHAALAVRNARLHAMEKQTVLDMASTEQAKTEFLSTVRHELRTPLTAIKASAGLLLDSQTEPLTENQERLVRSISRNAERMTRLVVDLLDMARLQSGHLMLTRELIDVRGIIYSCVSSLRPLMEQKEQTVEVVTPHKLPRVLADRRRVEQVLTNLVSNAHKYTPRGGHVVIGASATPEDVIITVSDNGPGIANEERGLIFERFYRGSAAIGNPTGAGMGLSVAKSLVELHGGMIDCRAAPGGGSEFYFTLPLNTPEMPEESEL